MEERVTELTPGEVVEYYESCGGREVVEYYVQDRPLPRRRAAAGTLKKRRKKTGLWVFLACCAVLAGVTAAAYFLRQPTLPQAGDSYGQDYQYSEDLTAKVTIPTYPTGKGVSMQVTETHGAEMTTQEVYARVNPSVVTVMVQLSGSMSVGTGVIFTEDGYILTNYHVVAGGNDCNIALDSGKTYSAKFVAGDSDNDIAILKVDVSGLQAAELGDSDNLTVGDRVYAIGNPLGVELRGTLTDGIVSAINRDVEVDGRTMTLIQTNAALNSGNSGGPLINSYGQVVGINTIKMSSSYSNIEGLGFALPTSSVQYLVNDLLTYGKVRPEPVIGISVSQVPTTLPDGTQGIEVYEVSKGSAAEEAGILEGDIVVSADGEATVTSKDLLRIRRRFNVGDQMKMRVYRDGKYLNVTLTLTKGSD